MIPPWYSLLARLAPGHWVGGPELADELNLSRAAVWKQIDKLRDMGLPVSAERGRGYRLGWPVELLDARLLREAAATHGLVLDIYAELASTNRYLSDLQDRHARAVIAEYQTGGRGRGSRRWLSPPATGLCFSLSWRFGCGLMRLGALSLVAGLAAAEAIAQATGRDIGLKWPNDLIVDDHKLGGCLVEISGTADGPCQAVIGIGINVRMPANFDPGQPWTDCHRLAGMGARNRLAAALLAVLPEKLARLEAQGFEAFRDHWARRDALDGRPVLISSPDGGTFGGLARGISNRGGLLVDNNGHVQELVMGEVSVRAA